MRRAALAHAAGSWDRTAEIGTITLAADARHRRRFRLTDDAGGDFLLDLPRAARLADGDGLQLDDGGIVRVVAALEPVADLVCASTALAVRLAWHIGNRHAPVQLVDDGVLRVEADPVILDLAQRLGATVVRRRAAFHPEPGAYDPHGLEAAPPPTLRRA